MVNLAALWPTTGKLTEPVIRGYAWALERYGVEEVRHAIVRARDAGTLGAFFPSAPEMLRLVAPPVEDAALLAWAGLRRAAADVGAYASLVTEDAAAGEALLLAFGSWSDFCAFDEGPAMHARRAEFLAGYRDARRRPRAASCRLPGLCEGTGKYRGGAGVLVGYLTEQGAVLLTADVTPAKALPEARQA